MIAIETMQDFVSSISEVTTILVERHEETSMAKISVNSNPIMGGNYWDFYPGCHGGLHYELAAKYGDYRGTKSMAEMLQRAVLANGAKECRITEGTYTPRA